jgi:hypothetical protein
VADVRLWKVYISEIFFRPINISFGLTPKKKNKLSKIKIEENRSTCSRLLFYKTKQIWAKPAERFIRIFFFSLPTNKRGRSSSKKSRNVSRTMDIARDGFEKKKTRIEKEKKKINTALKGTILSHSKNMWE